MADKTNSGLLAYAKAQVGNPYWYGTYGQTASSSLYNSKKAQYPSYYTATDFTLQYGKRVHDCVGLIKGYLWSESATATPKYVSAQDKNANGMYTAATTKGAISTFPGTAGLLVFKGTSTSKITHVGVYDGNGYVYEAKSHATGTLKTAFKTSEWNYWAQCPYTVDDTTTTETTTTETTVTTTYTAGTAVTLNKVSLYSSSTAASAAGTVSGTYYLWDSKVLNKRIRITNSTANVGKSGQVTGWISTADVPVAVSATTHTVVKGDTLSAIAKKYGSTVNAIVQANTAKYPKITADYIVVGWVLEIP